MIWLAFWFVAMVYGLTVVVVNTIFDVGGWSAVFDVGFAVAAAFFFFDHFKEEFFDG